MSHQADVENAPGLSPRTRRRPGRERLISAIDRFFYRDGLSSAVVDQLIAEAGVARGTFYNNFRNRDELIEAYLNGRHLATMAVLEQIASDEVTLQHRIDAIFDHLADLASDDLFRGCAFVVAAAELPGDQRPATRWARLHKSAAVDKFTEIFTSHEVEDPRSKAEQLAILYDGALVASYLGPGSDAVERTRDMAHRLLLEAQPREHQDPLEPTP
jgi:AcrR family transcriptional regulator